MPTRGGQIAFLAEDLTRFLDASTLSMAVTQRGGLVYANAPFLRSFGLSLDQAIGMDATRTITDPVIRERVRQGAELAQAGHPQDPLEYQTIGPDGGKLWARIESAPCMFRGQAASLSIFRDVTDQVEARRALLESQERSRGLFEDSPLAMAISQGARLILANAALARLAGVDSPERLCGMSLLDFADSSVREATLARLEMAQAGIETPRTLRRLRDLQGRELEVELGSKPFVFEGGNAVLTTFVEVSDPMAASQAVAATVRETEDRYRALVEGLPDGVVVRTGRAIVFANESIARMLGVPRASDLIGRDLFDFLAPKEWPAADQRLNELQEGRPIPPQEYEARRADGGRAVVAVFDRNVTFGDRPAVQSVIRDITERRRAERSQAAIYRIAEASARASSLEDLLESVHSAVGELMDARNFFIALKDPTGEFFTFPYLRDEQWSPPPRVSVKETLCSYVLAEGKPLLISGDEMLTLQERGVPALGPSSVSWIGVPLILRESSFGVLVVQSYRNEIRYTEADRDLLSYVSHHIAEAIDRQRKDDQIEYMAFHDDMTALPNRLLFEDRLTKALAQADRREAPLAILFVDLDRFKVINDSLGHPTGDEVLKLVGKRLTEGLRNGDSLARRGGDEFLVLLPDTPADGAILVAQKLIDNIRVPMHLGGRDLTISASCGIAVFPDDGHDAESLLKAADIAMYRAKESGRDAYRLYSPAMNAAAQRRLTVETKLRRSIARRDIGPHFQPIVNALTGRVVGAEALLRWSPGLTATMPPKEFIPVAEQSGLIVSLGAFVLREALEHAQSWPDSLGQPMRLAVNFAARQVLDPSCVDLILQVLRDVSFPANRLQLEVSESSHITADAAAVDRLRALRSEGVTIAIDDFGVGYSSLSRLRQLPFDTLKIDGSFIQDLTTDSGSGAVAGAVIALGLNLGLEVIAEGVETEVQKDNLLSRDCPLMQGFLFAGAMPPGVFAAWVGQRER